jgi:hypothetical protein
MTDNQHLWEILVPCTELNGVRIRAGFHREWDTKVQAISGGMTVLPPARGTWRNVGVVYRDRMIPVRFMATRKEMKRIVQMTLDHYKGEKAVMAYKISEDIILKFRE